MLAAPSSDELSTSSMSCCPAEETANIGNMGSVRADLTAHAAILHMIHISLVRYHTQPVVFLKDSRCTCVPWPDGSVPANAVTAIFIITTLHVAREEI